MNSLTLNRDCVLSFSASRVTGILSLNPPYGARSTFSNPFLSLTCLQIAFIILRLML